MKPFMNPFMKPYLVLASSSPKRKEILASLGLKFKTHYPKVEEITSAPSAAALAKTNAELKARAAAEAHPQAFIIAADTIVTSGERLFFKPRNLADGISMLNAYRDHPSFVISGVAVLEPEGKRIISRTQKSRFRLAAMSPERQEMIYRLIFSPHQSGGFSIEGLGSIILDEINGSYYNILGLPVYLLDKIFLGLGSDLLRFRRKTPSGKAIRSDS